MKIEAIVLPEVKQRLDAKCWKGKHKEGTKIKGGIRVNNCVPNEAVNPAQQAAIAISKKKEKGVDEAFQNDEANLYYRYDPSEGRVKQRMVRNDEERQAFAQGFKDTPEQALKVHGIIRSKFKPGKWVQKQGAQWVEVHPFGKKDVDEDHGPKKVDVPAYMRKKSGDSDWRTTHADLEKDKERTATTPQGLAKRKKDLGIEEANISEDDPMGGLNPNSKIAGVTGNDATIDNGDGTKTIAPVTSLTRSPDGKGFVLGKTPQQQKMAQQTDSNSADLPKAGAPVLTQKEGVEAGNEVSGSRSQPGDEDTEINTKGPISGDQDDDTDFLTRLKKVAGV